MKCLRIFATPDGESHFGEVDIPTTLTRSFPNGAPAANYESSRSAFYEASRVRFVHIPAGAREAGFMLVMVAGLFISLEGRAKRTFITHRVDSLPFGWMARSSLKRATERRDVSPLERRF